MRIVEAGDREPRLGGHPSRLYLALQHNLLDSLAVLGNYADLGRVDDIYEIKGQPLSRRVQTTGHNTTRYSPNTMSGTKINNRYSAHHITVSCPAFEAPNDEISMIRVVLKGNRENKHSNAYQ